MPKEEKSRREVINAIKTLPAISALMSAHDGHFDYELDLEVTVYGRNYGGKKVGPYFRLLTFEPGESIINEDEWGGNTFFFLVSGIADVFIKAPNQQDVKVAELTPGTQFGEMSVLAGVPRNATVKAKRDKPVQVLEVHRPALRLLRKLPKFGENLDNTYRNHGRDSALEGIKLLGGFSAEMVNELKNYCNFRVLCEEPRAVSREGTNQSHLHHQGRVGPPHSGIVGRRDRRLHRSRFLLWRRRRSKGWRLAHAMTLMGRTEVLEISVSKLRRNYALLDALLKVIATACASAAWRPCKLQTRGSRRDGRRSGAAHRHRAGGWNEFAGDGHGSLCALRQLLACLPQDPRPVSTHAHEAFTSPGWKLLERAPFKARSRRRCACIAPIRNA